MGEILRHAEIFHNTRQKAGPLRPAEAFTFVELGNFLTDVSQFRDPFAHLSAKRTVWKTASQSNPLSYIPIIGFILNDVVLDAMDIDVWIDDMFGSAAPAEKRYGMLAQYFEKVVLAITHLIFSDDIPEKELARKFLHRDLGGIDPIPPAEVERVFKRFFSQYYPHEHLDYPPYVLNPEQRKRHPMYQRRSTGLIAYLEAHIQYVAEELSRLEARWKRNAALPPTDPDRHDVLVTFGHLLHAVEDYFYHSNYVELYLWNSLRRSRPSNEPEESFKRWFAANALMRYRAYNGYSPGYGASALGPEPQAGLTRWQRKLMRRLRTPEYERNAKPSKIFSGRGLDLVFTGGFEANDMFHTMAGALESFEALFEPNDQTASRIPAEQGQKLKMRSGGVLRESDLALVRALFNAEHRTRMALDSDFKDKQVGLHAEQLKSGVYQKGIRLFFDVGLINTTGRDAFLAAVEIDQKMEDYGGRTPGVGGFLISFLAQAQGVVNESHKKAQQLDRKNMGKPDEGGIFDERSDNGVSSETVGTHTLLAKDTPKSQPLYEDANVLAKFASLSVATIMLNSINDLPSPAVGQDWEAILRHYMRFPKAIHGMWESQVLEYYRQTGNDPKFTDISDQPKYPPLQLEPGGRLEQLRLGQKITELEELYIALEREADQYLTVNLVPG